MRFAVTALILALAAGAYAQGTARASVSSTRVTQDVPFTITIEATGSEIGEPTPPQTSPNLKISSTPSGQGQSLSISGTSMRRSRQWMYNAVATKVGEVAIPSFTIEVDGESLKTDPVRLSVSPSSAPATRKPPGNTPNQTRRAQNSPGQGDGNPTWEDIVRIETKVDKEKVYQGEGITLTVSVWTLDWPGVMVNYTGPRNIEWPSTEGFYAGEIEHGNAYENRGNLPYNVEQFQRSVYPTQSGTLTIGPWSWQGRARAFTATGFPESRDYDLSTEPISIEVLPLPEPPPGFSGAVGSYTISASVENRDVTQGTPVKLFIRITGRGNPDAVGAPEIPALDWAHIGSPEVEIRALGSESSLIEKSFSYDLTPLAAGAHEFPGISFTCFEPLTGVYKTDTSDPVTLNVQEAPDGNRLITTSEQETAAQEKIRILAQDIEPITRDAAHLRPAQAAIAIQGGLLGVPPVAYLGFALFMRRRRRFREDISFARDYHARNKARKRLGRAASAKEPADEIFRALGDYLSDKFNQSNAGLTSQDAGALLTAHRIPQDLLDGYVKVMRACERERYASQKLSPHEIAALRSAALDKLDKVDAILRRERSA
ncbi:MAG: BatD family protein [Candidatus Hydrogenedentes bacterium]|nr:BatD family protein [Candidatus Hydrogenedentota bacterium]